MFSGAPGPGATNLVTPVANAFADSIPLLVLTGQVDRRYMNRNILQYADNISLFSQFCKSSLQAVSAVEIPNLISTSLQIASSDRPGPVHLDIPQNIQAELINKYRKIEIAQLSSNPPSQNTIDLVINLINQSKRPVIISGHGVIRSNGTDALLECAQLLGAPVATVDLVLAVLTVLVSIVPVCLDFMEQVRLLRQFLLLICYLSLGALLVNKQRMDGNLIYLLRNQR